MSVITVDPVKVSCWLISALDLQWLNKAIANNLIYFQLNTNTRR